MFIYLFLKVGNILQSIWGYFLFRNGFRGRFRVKEKTEKECKRLFGPQIILIVDIRLKLSRYWILVFEFKSAFWVWLYPLKLKYDYILWNLEKVKTGKFALNLRPRNNRPFSRSINSYNSFYEITTWANSELSSIYNINLCLP